MVQITTYPGTMPVAFAREGETARKSLFFEVQSDFWDAAGPHDSGPQNLMEGSACVNVMFAVIPLACRG